MTKKKIAVKTTYGFQPFERNVCGETLFEMREVTYEDGVPVVCSSTATTVTSFTLDGLKDLLLELQGATDKPVLQESDWTA
jgi:hypothetical protein